MKKTGAPRPFPAPPLRENCVGGMKCQMTHQNPPGAQEKKKIGVNLGKNGTILLRNILRESVAPYNFFVLLHP
jgi:hypothetical protein